MGAYSFADVNAAIVGPGGSFTIGADRAIANEGITIAFVGDRNTMTQGAGASVMHSLHVARPATVTLRLLKTSGANALLSVMYDLQMSSSALWGNNSIIISNSASGDVATALQCAFRKFPDNTYATEGNVMEWVFDSGQCHEILGIMAGNASI